MSALPSLSSITAAFNDADAVALLVIFVATVYALCFVINHLSKDYDEGDM